MQSNSITTSIKRFCVDNDIGETTVREMIKDGRLRAFRLGKKKLMIDLRSYERMVDQQQAEGMPECRMTAPAIETRKANQAAAKAEGKADKLKDANEILAEAGL